MKGSAGSVRLELVVNRLEKQGHVRQEGETDEAFASRVLLPPAIDSSRATSEDERQDPWKRVINLYGMDSTTKELTQASLRTLYHGALCALTLGSMDAAAEEGRDDLFRRNGQRYVEDFQQRMEVRDPLEVIMLEQIILSHHRVLILSKRAARVTKRGRDDKAIAIANQQCDAASNTLRRMVATFDEHRQPRRTLFAKNVNVTQLQQVVEQLNQILQISEIEKTSNELERHYDEAKTIPAFGRGIGSQVGNGANSPTVEILDRPTNGSGQAAKFDERVPARGTKRGSARATAASTVPDQVIDAG